MFLQTTTHKIDIDRVYKVIHYIYNTLVLKTNSSSNMSQIVCIEGNIGSGKSTLLNVLRRNYDGQKHMNNIPKFVFVNEPLDIWNTIRDKAGLTALQHFYNDQEKYAFSFQMMAYISRLSRLQEAIRNHPDAIIIVERSVFTDKHVFASMLYRDGKMNEIEFQVYLKWFDHFIQELPPISLVYVHTDPDVCVNRVKKRNRKGEEGISLEYLTSCHTYHEKMIHEMHKNQVGVLTLDGNSNKGEQSEFGDLEYIHWIKDIRDFIYKNKKETISLDQLP